MLDAESLSPSPPARPLSEIDVYIRDATSSPCIDCLPVELLCRAFCWLPHFDDEDNGVSLNSRTPPWIPVLHVCSFWRTITMECKELWSWIPLGHPEWTKMALRLSDPVAIALCVPGEHVFATFDESTPVAHYLMKEAFMLALYHLPRVWHFDLEMARPESSNAGDGEHYAAYVRARQMLAPLRNAHMSGLTSLRCTRTDFLAESFLEESWSSQVRDLWLVGCKIPKSLRISHLPLVKLCITLPYYSDSFADWITSIGTIKSLEKLIIWDALKPSHLEEIYADAAPSRGLRIELPHLKGLHIMRSPSLMGLYLRHFDVPLMTQLAATWWAADFDVPGALVRDSYLNAGWPLNDDLGQAKNTLDHKLYRLSAHLGNALLKLIHGVVTNAQYNTSFNPAAFKLPRVNETDVQNSIMSTHSISWTPESSTFAATWTRDTQPLYQDVLGVMAFKDVISECIPLIDIMREGDARDYARAHPVPAVFVCLFEPDALARAQEAELPTLILVALQHIDFTSPNLGPYFPALLYTLSRSNEESDIICDIAVVFPFGLKLSEDQRGRIMKWNLRLSVFVEDYQYPEFEDVNPYV